MYSRDRLHLGVVLGLLGASLAAAVAMAVMDVPVVSVADLPWLGLLTAVIAGIRLIGHRKTMAEGAAVALFWANLAVAAVAVWLSPVFGLYLFIGYYEAARFRSRGARVAGLVGVAVVIAVAQVGGPRSVLFTPVVYGAFVALNLAITALIASLDSRREALFVELTRANDDLRAEQGRSSALLDQLVAQAREAGIAEERARLSREIHDTVAQDLVAIIAQVDAASAAPDAAERERRLALVDVVARESLDEARRAVRALVSPRLDDADLPLALDDLLGQWRASSGLEGELRVLGRAASGGGDDVLLRIAQQSLANVAGHAQARRADVTLTYGDPAALGDRAVTRLEVTDDGAGFDPKAVGRGYGLAGMRDRLASVGGTLEVVTAPGAGTRVVAVIPAKGDEHA